MIYDCYMLGKISLSLARIYQKFHDNEKVKSYFELAKNYAYESFSLLLEGKVRYEFAKFNLKENNINQAIENINYAIDLMIEINNTYKQKVYEKLRSKINS